MLDEEINQNQNSNESTLYEESSNENIEEDFDNEPKKVHNNESAGEGEDDVAEDAEEDLRDVVFEDEEEPIDQIKKLKEKLKECRREKNEYLTALQRLRADYANKRNKEIEEKEKATEDTKDKFVADLLPIIDSFEMAFADSEVWESVAKQWRDGVEQIYSQLLNILKAHNVEQLNPAGKEFNPHLHEPVANVPVEEEQKDNIVTDVLQKGYVRGERVVRPAKVNVGQYNKS